MAPLVTSERAVGGSPVLAFVLGAITALLAVAAWLVLVSNRRIRSSGAAPKSTSPSPDVHAVPAPAAPAPAPAVATVPDATVPAPPPPPAAVAATLLARALSDVKLPPEPQCGCIEYKRKFACSEGDARFGELVAQMVWRINEGDGICMYFVGVEDDGEPSGAARVSPADVEHSDRILRAMAAELRVDVLFGVTLAPRARCYAIADHRRQHMPDYELYPTGDADVAGWPPAPAAPATPQGAAAAAMEQLWPASDAEGTAP